MHNQIEDPREIQGKTIEGTVQFDPRTLGIVFTDGSFLLVSAFTVRDEAELVFSCIPRKHELIQMGLEETEAARSERKLRENVEVAEARTRAERRIAYLKLRAEFEPEESNG